MIHDIERPHSSLLTYYVLISLAALPAAPILLVYRYFRYHTLRYRFEGEGLRMSWGILFRQEILLNYARIQDIHLRSNVLERWLGLARIEIQTASGSSQAEMTIEGLREFEQVRDFLYERMRGARHGERATAAAAPESIAGLLTATAAELRAIRVSLEARRDA